MSKADTTDPRHQQSDARMLDEAARHVPPAGAVLDCGCGTGPLADHLPQEGLRYLGLDVSPEAIRICRSRYGKRPGFSFLVGDVNSTEFELESQDVVALLNVLNLPGIQAVSVLRKARAALRRGGRVLVAGPTSAELLPGQGRYWSAEGMVALLTHVGFSRIVSASNEFQSGSTSMVVAAT